MASMFSDDSTIVQLAPFDMTIFNGEEQSALIERFARFFASLNASFRMYAITRPFSLQPVNERHDKLLRYVEAGPRQRALAMYARFVQQVIGRSHLKSAAFYLQVFGGRVRGEGLAAHVKNTFMTSTQVLDALPLLVEGRYRERPQALQPLDPQIPWLAFLHSYDLRGTLSPAAIFDLLRLQFPLALVVDVETIPTADAMPRLNMAHQTLMSHLLLRKPGDPPQIEAQQAMTDLQGVMAEVESQGTSVHRLSVAVAVMADLESELNERAEEVRQRAMTHQLWLRRGAPLQSELLSLFRGEPTPPTLRSKFTRGVTSRGPATLVPYGYKVRDRTDGILVGIDMDGGYPIFADRFTLSSYNKIVIGKTGSGKTWTECMLALREVTVMGRQAIILDPQQNARGLVEAFGGSYQTLDVRGETTMNILDFVEEKLPAQVSHVMVNLSLLIKRSLTGPEKTAVDLALMKLYESRDCDQKTPSGAMPVLGDLMAALEQNAPDTTAGLRNDLRRYVLGSLAPVFNAPTNLDLKLSKSVIGIDLRSLQGNEHQPLLLFTLLSIIERELFRRGRTQEGVIIVDEFGILSAIPELARAVEQWFRRIRTFGWGVTAIDQTWDTFRRVPGIVGNTQIKMLMNLDETEIPAVASALGLTRGHRMHLLTAQPGEGVLLIDQDRHRFKAVLSPFEQEVLYRATIKAQRNTATAR